MVDYYRLLGVVPTATPQQVWRAIRRYERRYAGQKGTAAYALLEKAAQALGNPRRRAVYDRVHGLNQAPASPFRALLQVAILQQELRKCRQQKERLEVASQHARLEVAHAYSYQEEMEAKRRGRWQTISRLGLGLLVLVGVRLLPAVFNPSPSLEDMTGKPYKPVAAGFRWSTNRDSTTQQQVELMPQFRNGAEGLRVHVRDQLLNRLPIERVTYLLETAHGTFIIDSTGRVGKTRVWGVANPLEAEALRQALATLPRFVPGFQEARPVSVRLALPLVVP